MPGTAAGFAAPHPVHYADAMPAARSASISPNVWSRWPRERLLDTRICDLGLRLEIGFLQRRIDQLYGELERRGLRFRPHFWLSDDWYTPDGVPGVAIPFFLAHARLRRLEHEHMMEVEGGSRGWCMRLLRHETGHALLNAYQLAQRRDWKKQFGRPSTPYPTSYLPKPYSKRFVLNLPNWYAQAHPHEDWAETFAVWLKPKSDWRKRYRSWPAVKKLEYVDALMKEVRQAKPRLRNRRTVLPVDKMRTSLRQYYEEKTARYAVDSPEFFDRDLLKLFVPADEAPDCEKAAHYIRRNRTELLHTVERWTSEYRYRINEVLKDMVKRCNTLDLRVQRSEQDMRTELVGCLTMLIMNKLHSGGFHVSL